jgi:protein-tyrosine phosphatase
VHCWAGVSRSATIVIAYLMRKNKWPLETAMDYVKQKRNFINPNHGFLAKLKDFETNHKTK